MRITGMAFTVILLLATGVYADGLRGLIDVSESQKETQKIISEETEAFKNVKKGLEDGAIQSGQSKDAIRERYGEPVVIIEKKENGLERWVYKPGSGTFFDGEKIYLFFDDDGLLNKTELRSK